MSLSVLNLFFISSRRRHTTCLSDWSSDVYSSDLLALSLGIGGLGSETNQPGLGSDASDARSAAPPRGRSQIGGHLCCDGERAVARRDQCAHEFHSEDAS